MAMILFRRCLLNRFLARPACPKSPCARDPIGIDQTKFVFVPSYSSSSCWSGMYAKDITNYPFVSRKFRLHSFVVRYHSQW